jgi:hypothetical protein
MLAERAGFLEDADLDITKISARFVVGFDKAGKRDRPRQSRRPAAHEDDIHRHGLGVRPFGEDQPIEWKRSLMCDRKKLRLGFCH